MRLNNIDEMLIISSHDGMDSSLARESLYMNIPGAVERRDGISVILCVLEKLDNIVSGDDTDGNIAFIDHFGLCTG